MQDIRVHRAFDRPSDQLRFRVLDLVRTVRRLHERAVRQALREATERGDTNRLPLMNPSSKIERQTRQGRGPLGIALWIWRHATTFTPWGRTRTIAFSGLLVALTVATPFLPPPRDASQFAWQALAGYVVLAALAGWLDRRSVTMNRS